MSYVYFYIGMLYGHGGWKCIYAVYMDTRNVCLLRSVVDLTYFSLQATINALLVTLSPHVIISETVIITVALMQVSFSGADSYPAVVAFGRDS
jgi:hypothetical protein